MNTSIRFMRRQWRPWPRAARTGCAASAVAAAALLAAACGAGPASTGSGSTPSTASSPSALSWARCMRSHGIPAFPDPNGNGQVPQETAQQLGVSESRLQTAASACQRLDPKQLPAALTAQQEQDYLKAAVCMRSHGISDFPDPTFPDGRVSLNIPSSIDTSSPQFTRARQICDRLIPAGLPYSGSVGG